MEKITIKDKEIKYILERKNVKNINIRIKEDNMVYISANNKVSMEYIENLLLKKSDWIVKSMDELNRSKVKKINNTYENGERIRYLGREYIVRNIEDSEEKVFIEGNYFNICTSSIENIKIKEKLVYQFYENKINEVFNESLKRMFELIKEDYESFPEIKFRRMKSRWGTCYIHKNKIIINKALIKADIKCIDYVILHELTHFIYKNHDKNFYNYMTEKMPDWRKREELLKDSRRYLSY